MKNIYAIWDNKAEEFIGRAMYTLMVFRTDQEATRYFMDAINDETSILHKHPEDYELQALGTIDDTGKITAHNPYLTIVHGNTVVAIQDKTQLNLLKDA